MQVKDISTNSWFNLNILRGTGTIAKFFKVLDQLTGEWHTTIVIEDDVIDIITGPKGDTGPRGDPSTINVGIVTTLPAGSTAMIDNVGTSNDAILNFSIPRGDTGDAATITVGNTTTLSAGQPASVTNVGDQHDAILNFAIPTGPNGLAATVAVGSVSTGSPGSSAAVLNSGSIHNAILDFTIPRGDTGDVGDRGYSAGMQYVYSTSTTQADPGNGRIRFNNTNLSLATFIYIDNLSAAGSLMSSWYESFDDTGSAVKGQIIIHNEDTDEETTFVLSSLTAMSGYYRLAITYISGVTAITNNTTISLLYTRTGDKGDGIPPGGIDGQLVQRTSTGYDWSLNLRIDAYGFTTGVDSNLMHLQNYYSGIGYYTQNLRRDSVGNWNLDNPAHAGAGIVFQTNPGVDTGKIHILACQPGYNSSSFPAIATWDIATSRYGINTQTPTAGLDVNASIRLRQQLFDSTNSNGGTGMILGNNAGSPVWKQEPNSNACSVWCTLGGSSIFIAGQQIALYSDVWLNDGNMNTTSGIYTVPITGVYKIEFNGLKDSSTTNAEVRVYKNYAATAVRSYASSPIGEFTPLSISVIGVFTAGDLLAIGVTQGAIHANESCYLNIYRIR